MRKPRIYSSSYVELDKQDLRPLSASLQHLLQVQAQINKASSNYAFDNHDTTS